MRQLSEALAPLQAKQNWVIWRWRDSRKVPYQALRPHAHASVTNQSHWSSYAHAVAAAPKDGGVGFVLLNSGIGAIDLDDCIDSDGVIADWAQEILDLMPNCYREVTVSGRGLRMLGLATGRRIHRKLNRGTGSIEIWRDAERFTVICGREFGRCRRLPNIDALLDSLVPDGTTLRDIDTPDIDIRGLDWREILKRYGLRHLTSYVIYEVPGPVEGRRGKRSDVVWRLIMDLKEKGASPSETAAVAWASKAWKSKWGDNIERLRRQVGKAFNE